MNRCNYEEYDAFISKDKHKHGNPVKSLEYAQIKGTVIRVAAHKRKSTHKHVVPYQNTKTQQFEGFTHTRKSGDYF